jgi:uncharacterized protein (TIGR00159 family)
MPPFSPHLLGHAVRWQDGVDIAVLTLLFSSAYGWLRRTRAVQVTFGLLTLLGASWLANRIGLILTSYLLSAGGAVATLVVVVVFQHEIRRGLSRVSPLTWLARRSGRRHAPVDGTCTALAQAAFTIARRRKGALVVLLRRDTIAEHVTAGAEVDARISAALLEAIFTSTSPFHDGAVLIRADRLLRAGVVLPLATGGEPQRHGTRHRAALGLAQLSDALVICVSEESGAVSLAHDARLEPIRSENELADLLGALSAPRAPVPARAPRRPRLRSLLPYAAIFAAVVVSWAALALDRTQVVSRIVPLELRDVSDNLVFDPPRASSVAVELRGSHAELEAVPIGGVEAYVELSAATPGVHAYPVVVRAPAGIDVVGVRPAGVVIQIRARAPANAAPVATAAPSRSPPPPTAALR